MQVTAAFKVTLYRFLLEYVVLYFGFLLFFLQTDQIRNRLQGIFIYLHVVKRYINVSVEGTEYELDISVTLL